MLPLLRASKQKLWPDMLWARWHCRMRNSNARRQYHLVFRHFPVTQRHKVSTKDDQLPFSN